MDQNRVELDAMAHLPSLKSLRIDAALPTIVLQPYVSTLYQPWKRHNTVIMLSRNRFMLSMRALGSLAVEMTMTNLGLRSGKILRTRKTKCTHKNKHAWSPDATGVTL